MNLLEENESQIVFPCKKSGLDIVTFLNKKNLSGRLFRKLYRSKNIYINGYVAQKRKILQRGDIVTIVMEDEINNIKPESMNFEIVYEDDDILVINKEASIVVHPTKSHQTATLSNGISHYFRSKGYKKKVRFVNRLDMDTTGLLIVAKNPYAHQQMAVQFENNQVHKKYYAIVEGLVEKDNDSLDFPIGREEERSIRKTVRPGGQNALTKYRVLERYKNASLLDIQIFTGRSHQIRVHLSHIGHPIIGDHLYNSKSDYIDRQSLHSYFLGIKGIRDKASIELKTQLPEDMKELIEKLK